MYYDRPLTNDEIYEYELDKMEIKINEDLTLSYTHKEYDFIATIYNSSKNETQKIEFNDDSFRTITVNVDNWIGLLHNDEDIESLHQIEEGNMFEKIEARRKVSDEKLISQRKIDLERIHGMKPITAVEEFPNEQWMDEADKYLQSEGWLLAKKEADDYIGYQIYVGENVQVDNHTTFVFPYLFEKKYMIEDLRDLGRRYAYELEDEMDISDEDMENELV